MYLPLGPSYIYYDYPYYYSRGFYPTHIGPRYVYYGHPYFYGRGYHPIYGGKCFHRHRKCSPYWRY